MICKPQSFILALCAALAMSAAAQTFDVSGGGNQKGQPKSSQGPGFGTSIGVARLSRGADEALKRGNPGLAATYAKQATEAAPNNVQLWFTYGYAARLANRLAESEQAYQHGLRVQPGNLDGMSGLAQTYEKMGRNEDAKRLLLRVVNANPNRLDDMLIAGDLFMRTGNPQEGINLLQRAESRKPNTHAELLLAIGYMRLHETARAKQLLEMAKKRDPKNTDVFRAVANVQREDKDYAGAITTLKAAPGKNPEVLADLAYTYELAGDGKQAASVWESVANAQPQNIQYQLAAGQAALNLHDVAQAKRYVQRAAALQPDQYRVHALRAGIAREEKRTDDAIRELNLSLARMPESVPEGVLYPIQLRMSLAELLKETGRDDEAKQQMAIAEQQADKLQIEGPARAEFLRVRAAIRTSDENPEAMKAAEADLQEAMKLDPKNLAAALQYANLLGREKRRDESKNAYLAVLQKDPKNRFAIEGLGYLARDAGNNAEAEKYFRQFATWYPDDYVPYLALGDLYTAQQHYNEALREYDRGYALNKDNAAIVANAANAALELHKYDVAKTWITRITPDMERDRRVMVQRERYLFWQGDYVRSSELGYAVLKDAPKDRNASVYLAYDLYNMGRRDDVLALATKYENIIPEEPNFPLLEGHVHRLSQLLDEAVDDYSRSIARDPNTAEAYINRGYVYNDLQRPQAAIKDFDMSLKLQPNKGTALLGRSFAHLELKQSQLALEDAQAAMRTMGNNGPIELALATAYRQLRRLPEAETHYNAALQYAPNDISLWLALADTQYQSRQYQPSINSLNQALKLDAHDPLIYAEQAHAYARLHDDRNTLVAVKNAEAEGSDQAAVLLATGDALLLLKDRKQAMMRFGRALNAPDANRVDVRLALAKLFAAEGRFEDARQQIAFGMADARVGDSAPVSADNLIEAGNILLAMHDYDLAWRFFDRAHQAGAPDQDVALGEANTFLALGDYRDAESALALFGDPSNNTDNFEYQLAMANFYRGKNDLSRSMVAYARAHQLSTDPNDMTLIDSERDTAAQHGLNLTKDLTVDSDTSFAPTFEDSTIYALDAKLLSNGTSQLPPPRSNFEWRQTTGFRYAPDGWIPITGFWQIRDERGKFSYPALNRIINRNTVDTSFAGGVEPVLHFGDQSVRLHPGVEFTLRRDTRDAIDIDQQLFRQFLYLDTSPLFNWISIRGNAFRESGPFVYNNQHSTEYAARLEFQVGRPWRSTSLITGYTADDLQFRPLVREFFTTSTYAGVQKKFGQRVTVTGLAEIVRSWRVQDNLYATSQAIQPGGNVEARLRRNWSLNAFGTWQSNKTVGAYDNVQSGLFISYTRPLHQSVNDGFGAVPVEMPLRLSVGLQQESFMHFTGSGNSTVIRPVIRLTLF